LLPDRTKETLQGWLQQHPEVEIITRDRSFKYRLGIKVGAPQALQVVDRWHLLHNLREKLPEILPKVMNKRQYYLAKMIALALITFVVGYLFAEGIRDVCYGKLEADKVADDLLNEVPEEISANRKWQLYSGLFILLKQKPRLPDEILSSIAKSVAQVFPTLVYDPVRTFV
jgi:hypothetical protein